MAGTARVVIGIILIIVGIFGLFIFFIGIIPIIIGALLIWSGRGAAAQERTTQMLQQQQAQLAYLQGQQALQRPPAPYYASPQQPYSPAPTYAPGAQYQQPPPPPSAYVAPPPPPAAVPPAERYCPSCGTGNLRTSGFCHKCGKPLPPPS